MNPNNNGNKLNLVIKIFNNKRIEETQITKKCQKNQLQKTWKN